MCGVGLVDLLMPLAHKQGGFRLPKRGCAGKGKRRIIRAFWFLCRVEGCFFVCFLVMGIYWEQVGSLKMGVCFLRRWGVFFMLGNVEACVSGCL